MQSELNRYLVESRQRDLRREAADERLARQARPRRTDVPTPDPVGSRRGRRLLPVVRLAGVRIF
jgi:hypothetical protein